MHVVIQVVSGNQQVTAPQLTLLENEMAKIEMVSAYIKLMGCGANRDVFQVWPHQAATFVVNSEPRASPDAFGQEEEV